MSNYTKPFFLFWYPLDPYYKYNNPHNYMDEIEKGHFGKSSIHIPRHTLKSRIHFFVVSFPANRVREEFISYNLYTLPSK